MSDREPRIRYRAPPNDGQPSQQSKGRNPPEEYRFRQGQSGNPKGRPPKRKPVPTDVPPEVPSLRKTIREISKLPMQVDVHGIPQAVVLKYALTLNALTGGLHDPRLAFKALELIEDAEEGDGPPTEGDPSLSPELDPVIQRETDRRLRRYLQQHGLVDHAIKLAKEMYGEAPDEDGTEAPSDSPSADGKDPS